MRGGVVLLGGTAVTAGRVFRADLRVHGERIVEIGEDLKAGRREHALDCSGQYIYPGLINAHDHLSLNLFPHLGDPPYANSYDWGGDIHARYKDIIATVTRIPIRDRLCWGAWKNLFSGVTTVVHHDPYFAHFRIRYPVDVLSRYTYAHSLRFEPDMARALGRRRKNTPFIIHLAEGVDRGAAGEVAELNTMHGLDHRTVAVHGVAIGQDDVATLRESGASLVWCPASNRFLFNAAAPVGLLKGNVPMAIGTDSTLTGSESLFDELRVARREMSFSPQEVFAMVTDAPRKIFRLDEGAGTILERGAADLFLLPARDKDPYAMLLEARPGDVTLLMRRGRIVFHDPQFDAQLAGHASCPGEVILNGRIKRLASTWFRGKHEKLKQFLGHYSYLS